MPLGSSAVGGAGGVGVDGAHHHIAEPIIGGEINPMDFINNCCDDVVGGPSVHDDDVFVNLDAFDMFVEFPDLELDAKSSFMSSVVDASSSSLKMSDNDGVDSAAVIESISDKSQSDLLLDTADDVVNGTATSSGVDTESFSITDYSPEWAYPEGGVKVLVTGPWVSASTNYTVLFDAFPVPTTVVQSGVLRCYCPAHEVGLATLQVACDGYVISNSVIFEYKAPPNVEAICDGVANESLYKLSLYNRLEAIDERMQIKSEPKESVSLRITIIYFFFALKTLVFVSTTA